MWQPARAFKSSDKLNLDRHDHCRESRYVAVVPAALGLFDQSAEYNCGCIALEQAFCASHLATRNSQRLNGFCTEPESFPLEALDAARDANVLTC